MQFFEFASLRALVRDAVVGGGIGVQSHGVRVDVQDVVGRDAGAVLQGFYAGFCGQKEGDGQHLVARGGADEGGEGVFPVRGCNHVQVVGMQVPGDDEPNAGVPEVVLFRRAVVVAAPQAIPELHGSLQGAVGEN